MQRRLTQILFQTLNHDITKAYLDIVTTYVSLMVLLSRVEDRKAVLGLFNAAHEMVHSNRYDSLNHNSCTLLMRL